MTVCRKCSRIPCRCAYMPISKGTDTTLTLPSACPDCGGRIAPASKSMGLCRACGQVVTGTDDRNVVKVDNIPDLVDRTAVERLARKLMREQGLSWPRAVRLAALILEVPITGQVDEISDEHESGRKPGGKAPRNALPTPVSQLVIATKRLADGEADPVKRAMTLQGCKATLLSHITKMATEAYPDIQEAEAFTKYLQTPSGKLLYNAYATLETYSFESSSRDLRKDDPSAERKDLL